jgi:fluoride ion exporter CrcB/FEX
MSDCVICIVFGIIGGIIGGLLRILILKFFKLMRKSQRVRMKNDKETEIIL